MIRRFVLALVLATAFMLPAYSTAPIENDGTATILTGANTITLGTGLFGHVIVYTSSSASTVNVTLNMGVTATASNAPLVGGSGLSYGLNGNMGATNQINYYCATGSPAGTISWVAW